MSQGITASSNSSSDRTSASSSPILLSSPYSPCSDSQLLSTAAEMLTCLNPLTTTWGFSDKYSPISTSHFAVNTFSKRHVDWLYLYSFYILNTFNLLVTSSEYQCSNLHFRKSLAGLFTAISIGWSKSVTLTLIKQNNVNICLLASCKLLTESVIWPLKLRIMTKFAAASPKVSLCLST